MVLAHHSCNKYKSTKIYSNDLSWIKQNRYAQAVDEKYSSLMNEYGTAEATAIPSPLSSTQLDERTSKTLPENRQTRRNKDSTLKRALLSFGLVCLIAIAPAFVLEILEVAKKASIENINASLTDEKRMQYTEQAVKAYSGWKEKYGMPGTTNRTQCGEGYLGNENIENRLVCEHKITYSINAFNEILDETRTSVEQTGKIPGATNENIALYRVARCAEESASQTGTVLLTHSPYIAELRDAGSYDDVAAVIRLSDGAYFCTDNN